MQSFLIDECCSPDLVAEALTAGHQATHVNYLGLSGSADRDLIPIILDRDYLLVTNNRRDFIRLYADLDLHAGLAILLPSVSTAKQVALFAKVLATIGAPGFDTVNQLIEVAEDGSVTMSAWPFDGNAP